MTSSTSPPDERGRDAEGRGDCGGEGGSRDAEQQRPPRADDDLREDVAPLVGRAEEVVPGGRLAGRRGG